MANAESRRTEGGWGGRGGRLVGGVRALPKKLKITPISAAEPIDRLGDPSGEVLMGSLLI